MLLGLRSSGHVEPYAPWSVRAQVGSSHMLPGLVYVYPVLLSQRGFGVEPGKIFFLFFRYIDFFLFLSLISFLLLSSFFFFLFSLF